jgi:hypothetical protein
MEQAGSGITIFSLNGDVSIFVVSLLGSEGNID